MTELIVLSAAVLILLVGVGVHVTDRVGAQRLVIRRRVLVQLHSGRAFTGVLYRRRGRLIVLKNAEMLEPGNQPTTMDGEVVLDRGEVEYVQAVN